VRIQGRQRRTPLTRLSHVAAIGPATLTRVSPCSRGASARALTQIPGTLTRQNCHSREIPTIPEPCQHYREHLTRRRYATPSAFLSHLVELLDRATNYNRIVSALLPPLYRLPFLTLRPVGLWGPVPPCPVLLRISHRRGPAVVRLAEQDWRPAIKGRRRSEDRRRSRASTERRSSRSARHIRSQSSGIGPYDFLRHCRIVLKAHRVVRVTCQLHSRQPGVPIRRPAKPMRFLLDLRCG
jgi:hypothetical protein